MDLISIIYSHLTKDKYKKDTISFLYDFKIGIAKGLKKLFKDLERTDHEKYSILY